MSSRLRVAYLNSQYPALSHTFIEREVRALRELGAEVHTFSVRSPGPDDMLSRRHSNEAKQTFYLLRNLPQLVLMQLWALFAHPWAYMRTLIASQKLSPVGIRSRFWHICYAAEGVKLALELRRRKLSHVHVHMANNGAAIAILATTFAPEISYSLSMHGSDEFYNTKTFALTHKVEAAMFVRCISDYCKAQVLMWSNPSRWDRVHIVHCGIDAADFPVPSVRSSGPLRLLAIGRLVPIKGFGILLQACRKLDESGIGWVLEIVGDGAERALLEAMCRRLRIVDRVTFAGAVGQDTIQQHIASADVVVVSSFMEGVPVVLMEAMAMQRGVIASGVGGIPELVEDGKTGLLVRPSSIESLVEALRRLVQDRTLLSTMGPAARRKVMNEFSIDRSAEAMYALFEKYLLQIEETVPGRENAAIIARSQSN